MSVDLTFHEQLHICQVRCWPSCSGSLAWLGSHPSHSLATRKDATVEVVLPTCHKCFSKPCLLFGPCKPTSLYAAKGSCEIIITWGQPPASRIENGPE